MVITALQTIGAVGALLAFAVGALWAILYTPPAAAEGGESS